MGQNPASSGHLIAPMMTPEIDVVITLFPSHAGGRQHAITGEYRGVLSLSEDEAYSMRFTVPSQIEFRPGHTLTVGVQFLFPEMALPRFPIDATFRVWEGGIVGHGRVVRIHDRVSP
jgi:hypothetical protein